RLTHRDRPCIPVAPRRVPAGKAPRPPFPGARERVEHQQGSPSVNPGRPEVGWLPVPAPPSKSRETERERLSHRPGRPTWDDLTSGGGAVRQGSARGSRTATRGREAWVKTCRRIAAATVAEVESIR